MKTRRSTSTITRRRLLTQTLRGIAGLSAVAFLGMKIPEVKRDPGELWAECLRSLLQPRKTNWTTLLDGADVTVLDTQALKDWDLKRDGNLQYNGQLSQSGIMYFTAPTPLQFEPREAHWAHLTDKQITDGGFDPEEFRKVMRGEFPEFPPTRGQG